MKYVSKIQLEFLRIAINFKHRKDYDKYMKEHRHADPKKHTIGDEIKSGTQTKLFNGKDWMIFDNDDEGRKELNEEKKKLKKVSNIDYSQYLGSTPADGGEYYTLHIPTNVKPPEFRDKLNLKGVNVVVFLLTTPEQMAKGRGGPVARYMIENGIGWYVNCLPEGHEYLKQYDDTLKELYDKLISHKDLFKKSRELFSDYPKDAKDEAKWIVQEFSKIQPNGFQDELYKKVLDGLI